MSHDRRFRVSRAVRGAYDLECTNGDGGVHMRRLRRDEIEELATGWSDGGRIGDDPPSGWFSAGTLRFAGAGILEMLEDDCEGWCLEHGPGPAVRRNGHAEARRGGR